MAVVLVAGGASGIGLACVHAFRERGDHVLVADIDEEGARAACDGDLSGEADWIACDLADADAPRTIIDRAVERFGALDVVFANAGVLHAAPLQEWTVEAWDRTIAVNLRAPFLLAQAAAPHLVDSRVASMVFTSSTGALRGHAGMPAYGASKAGLVNLVRCLVDELSPQGIRINTVLPGWVDTPFNDPFWSHQDDPEEAVKKLEASIPLRRQARPEELTGLVLFLASDASAYVTGEAIVIDGGFSAV